MFAAATFAAKRLSVVSFNTSGESGSNGNGTIAANFAKQINTQTEWSETIHYAKKVE